MRIVSPACAAVIAAWMVVEHGGAPPHGGAVALAGGGRAREPLRPRAGQRPGALHRRPLRGAAVLVYDPVPPEVPRLPELLELRVLPARVHPQAEGAGGAVAALAGPRGGHHRVGGGRAMGEGGVSG